jgi:hypothetical protein
MRTALLLLAVGLASAADPSWERTDRARTIVSVGVFVLLAGLPVFVAWYRDAKQLPAVIFLAVWAFLGICAHRSGVEVPMAPHFACMTAWVLALWRKF